MKPYTLLLLGLLLASAAEAQTTDEARLEVTVTDAASGEALGYAVCSLRPKEGNGRNGLRRPTPKAVCLLEGLKPGRFELRLLYMGHVFLQRRTATSRRTDPPPNPARHRSGGHRRGAGDGRRIQRAHVVVEDRPRSHRPHPAVEHRRPYGADPRRPRHRPLVRSAAGDPPARSRPFELRQLRYVGIGYPDSGRRHPHK